MFEYKSEIVETGLKLFLKDSANEKDVEKFDEVINKRVAEGWEFVTHSYMPNASGPRSAILITFRREK